MSPSWILRGVNPPTDGHHSWACGSCPHTTQSSEDMIQHLDHYGNDIGHIAAFSCLYCAESHHTKAGLQEHLKLHSTDRNFQESSEVCIGVASRSDDPESARRQGAVIAQNAISGTTLHVYQGESLGEIHCLSALTDSAILLLIFSGYQLPQHGGILLLGFAWVCPDCRFGSNDHSEFMTHVEMLVFSRISPDDR